MAKPKPEPQEPEESSSLQPVGTKASGFDSRGPYSCMNCIHRNAATSACEHPEVMADPELADRKLPDGTIKVDFDDCCNFVNPGDEEDEDEGEGEEKNERLNRAEKFMKEGK